MYLAVVALCLGPFALADLYRWLRGKSSGPTDGDDTVGGIWGP